MTKVWGWRLRQVVELAVEDIKTKITHLGFADAELPLPDWVTILIQTIHGCRG